MSDAGSGLTVGEVLSGAVKMAHWVLQGTTADVDDELANRPAAGMANPIGSCYLHIAVTEDHFVATLQGAQALYEGEYADRFGGDKMEPHQGEGDLGDWYRTVKVDMAQARQYMDAVTAQTDEYLAGCSEADFAVVVEKSPIPNLTLAAFLEVFIVGHCNSLAGEISAIKGTFGLKGYPF